MWAGQGLITGLSRAWPQPLGLSGSWWCPGAALRVQEQSWVVSPAKSCCSQRSVVSRCVLLCPLVLWGGPRSPCASCSPSVLDQGLAEHEVLGAGKRQHLPHQGQGFMVLPLYCCVYKPGALYVFLRIVSRRRQLPYRTQRDLQPRW